MQRTLSWVHFLVSSGVLNEYLLSRQLVRKRFNVLGALNAITHEVITVTNETYINAESVCELLRKIAELSLSIPITLVLDNARYQKCQLVKELAETLGINRYSIYHPIHQI